MVAQPTAADPSGEVYLPLRRRSYVRPMLRFATHKPLGAAGALVLVLLCVLAVFGSELKPYDENLTVANILQDPSWSHPFGTDFIGRDLFSRVIVGAKTSFFIGILVVLISTGAGLLIGSVSAYWGGTLDLLLQRVVDAFQAIPLIVFGAAVVTVLGPGMRFGLPFTIIIALGIIFTPVNVRVIRASGFGVMAQPYVLASRSTGATHLRLIFRHLIPNLMAPVIVLASVQLGAAVLVEASLAFLGIGVPPPTPTWGGLLSGETRTYMQQHPHLAIFPGLALVIFVMGVNFLGDAIRDVLDPRLRGGNV